MKFLQKGIHAFLFSSVPRNVVRRKLERTVSTLWSKGRREERQKKLGRRAPCAFKIKRERGKQREVEKARAKERYGRHAWSRRRPVRKQTDCFAGSFVMRPWHINYFPTGSTPCPPHSLPMLLVFLFFTFFLRLLNDYRFREARESMFSFDFFYCVIFITISRYAQCECSGIFYQVRETFAQIGWN